MVTLLAYFLFYLFSLVNASITWSSQPFNPPAIPLAVRTPYLNTWMRQGQGAALNGGWPTFWNSDITGWAGYIRVDGTSCTFMGIPSVVAPGGSCTQKSFTFTATQSTFVLGAGPVDLTVNFLSPIEPDSLVNQSFPFSYMALSAVSTDGKTHSVQFYTDISCEWCSGDITLPVSWGMLHGPRAFAHQAQLVTPDNFTEYHDHIQQGTVYFATVNQTGLTYSSGMSDLISRGNFLQYGYLPNSVNTTFRPVSEEWPVFALSYDSGEAVSTTPSSPVVFAIGLVRDPAVEYTIGNGQTQQRDLYFRTRYAYGNILEAMGDFLVDYPQAVSRASAFDAQLHNDASKVSLNYSDVLALSVRQVFASMEITLSKNAQGAYDTNDVMIFVKEISSSGMVSTVDVLYASWPIFLYTAPQLCKYLLIPILQYQASGQWPEQYAPHDIGTIYPQALGHNNGVDETMGLEESANMIIMALSHYQKTNDNSLLYTYSNVFSQYGQYLLANSLIPGNQNSTDDFAGPLVNQTNLAIKGIIGIEAMSKIWDAIGNNNAQQSSNYSTTAQSYVKQWETLSGAQSQQHLYLSYNDPSTWGLTYNLYADKLLGLGLFSESVYDLQTKWYSTVEDTYGIVLDTRHTYTKSDWEMFTAAIVTDPNVQTALINSVRSHAANGLNSNPMSDWYDTTSGTDQGFAARPVVGGHFALLVMSNSSGLASEHSGLSGAAKGGIAGGIIGALLLAAIAFGVWWFIIRPRRRKEDASLDEDWGVPHAAAVEPYTMYSATDDRREAPWSPYGVIPEMSHTQTPLMDVSAVVAGMDHPPSPSENSKSNTNTQSKGGNTTPRTTPGFIPPPVTSQAIPIMAENGSPSPGHGTSPLSTGPRQEVDAQDATEEILPPPYRYRGTPAAPGTQPREP